MSPSDQGPELREPLPLDRVLVPRVWGGRRLEQVPGIALDVEGPVGESWEIFDGGEGSSRVAAGPRAGLTLGRLMASDREALLGGAAGTAEGRFPVLVKYLDAGQTLSVQVHPDRKMAECLGGGAAEKSEVWYVLEAEPGSLFYLGLQPGVGASDFAEAARGPGVTDLLQTFAARAGEVVSVPAGTVHAIGRGITLVEVQQNSDTTYRIYDWERTGLDGRPRELHLKEALLSIDYEALTEGPRRPEITPCGQGATHARLHDGPFFGMDLYDVDGSLELDTGGFAVGYLVLRGAGLLELQGDEPARDLAPASTWLLPAAAGVHTLRARGSGLQVLRVTTRG